MLRSGLDATQPGDWQILQVATSSHTREGLETSRWDIDSILRITLLGMGREYVSLLDILCDREGCPTRIGPDRVEGITSWDNAHIIPIASEVVARGGTGAGDHGAVVVCFPIKVTGNVFLSAPLDVSWRAPAQDPV